MTVSADIFAYPDATFDVRVTGGQLCLELRPDLEEAGRVRIFLMRDRKLTQAAATRVILDNLQAAISTAYQLLDEAAELELSPSFLERVRAARAAVVEPADAAGPDDDEDDDEDEDARNLATGPALADVLDGTWARGFEPPADEASLPAPIRAALAENRYDQAHPMTETEQRLAWGDR